MIELKCFTNSLLKVYDTVHNNERNTGQGRQVRCMIKAKMFLYPFVVASLDTRSFFLASPRGMPCATLVAGL